MGTLIAGDHAVDASVLLPFRGTDPRRFNVDGQAQLVAETRTAKNAGVGTTGVGLTFDRLSVA